MSLKFDPMRIQRSPFIAEHPSFETEVPKVLAARSVRPETVSMEPLQNVWEGSSNDSYGEAAVIQTAALVLAQLKTMDHSAAQDTVTQWWEDRNRE